MATRDERSTPLSPQLALRVAIVGGCALVMFGIVFFRLWVLQVLTGSQYVSQAQSNVVRRIEVPAPRGEMVDREGSVLVRSIAVPSIQISAPDLPKPITDTEADLSSPPAADLAVYAQLAHLLGISRAAKPCHYQLWIGDHKHTEHARLPQVACMVARGISASPFAKVTIRSGVSRDVQAYIAEHQAGTNAFKGVESTEVYERQYPDGSLAAQLFGTLGPITAQELKACESKHSASGQCHFKGVANDDQVGQSGLEYTYNQYLQGTDGYQRAKVSASGSFEGWERGRAATGGDNLQLSLDARLQRVGEESLAKSISTNGGDGGAFVAMDPQNGQIYAMGSNPTFNPSIFTKPVSTKEWAALNSQASNYPLLNRAIGGGGPDGSTFKVITATAALESGALGLGYVYDDTGRYCIPGSNPNIPGDCPQDAGGRGNGPVNLVKAIQVSSDTFFYRLGYLMNSSGALQKWAGRFGVGRPTRVDLPGEFSGTMASAAEVRALNHLQQECVARKGQFKHHRGPCQISDNGTWTPGDNVHAAVGQGDVQITPLQLAVVYAAMANNGTIVTPHVGMDVRTASGQVVDKIDPGPKRHLDINPLYRQAILQGLYDAAHDPGGTSQDVMGNFPEQVYGKTGTAQYGQTSSAAEANKDSAWYACFVPATATSKPIVVVVWVQNGGFGDVAAAPVARQILSQWFLGKPGTFKSGVSTDL